MQQQNTRADEKGRTARVEHTYRQLAGLGFPDDKIYSVFIRRDTIVRRT